MKKKVSTNLPLEQVQFELKRVIPHAAGHSIQVSRECEWIVISTEMNELCHIFSIMSF